MSATWAVLLAAVSGGLLSLAGTLIAQRYEARRQAINLTEEREKRQNASELEALGEIQKDIARWLEDATLDRFAVLYGVKREHADAEARSDHDTTVYHVFPEMLHVFWLCERVRDERTRAAIYTFLQKCVDNGSVTPLEADVDRHSLEELTAAAEGSGISQEVESLVSEYLELQRVIGARMRRLS